MDSELPHCTVCLKQLSAGWRCKDHMENEMPTPLNSVVTDLKPCRYCGAECRVEKFDSPLVKATLWICANARYFGGDCPDERAYLFEQSWQDAMQSASTTGSDELVSRVAVAIKETCRRRSIGMSDCIFEELARAALAIATPDTDRAKPSEVARDRADWLLDAVATATQDRRYLRGDPEYDEVAGEAILLNGEKAILVALHRAALSQPLGSKE